MTWIAEIKVGQDVCLHMGPEDLVDDVDQCVILTLLYKRGTRAKFAITAPPNVRVEVIPPGGVTLAPNTIPQESRRK